MRSKWTTAVAALATLALAMMTIVGVRTAGAASVTPIFYSGTANQTCGSLLGAGYFELKVDPPANGTYTSSDGYLTVTISNLQNTKTFDWSSNIGVDAVYVKAGAGGSYLYVYDPESTGDTNLTSPGAGTTNQISHISFCYDFNVEVSKTAETSFTRTYEWDIEKNYDQDYNLFTGDSVTHGYEVVVTKTGFVDSGWEVSGEITIENPAPVAASITDVSDSVSGFGDVDVDCGVSFPYSLAAGGTLTCSYSTALPDGTARTNTATVTTSGAVGGGAGEADVTFGAPTDEVNASVTVTDTNAAFGGPYTVDDDATWTYTSTFTCDADEGEHVNTATIEETGQSDTATVNVNCYELAVTKTADEALTRTWNWTIEKVGDQSALLLSVGQSFLVNYDVTVDATSTDSGWMVTGDISVHNPAPIAATINTVADIVSPNIAATVDCGAASFPYQLAAGGTLSCDYSADLPNADSRTNTATATLQNYDYEGGVGTPSGTTDFSGTAAVNFAGATMTEVDECIDVSDSLFGALGTVCADEAPKTFEYSMYVGPYDTCGAYEFVNVASFVTNDTGATGDDDHTVTVTVPCVGGCTLTQGYWKTHSKYGPAPYDNTWAGLAGFNEDTSFFLSGKTYYQVLWTAPAGNPYYNLAHQYIAAKLNIANGASSTPAVTAAIASAENLFNTYTPAQVAALKANNADRKLFVSLATTLDNYNNGVVGPGHCSE